jgi:hypothetical protein
MVLTLVGGIKNGESVSEFSFLNMGRFHFGATMGGEAC